MCSPMRLTRPGARIDGAIGNDACEIYRDLLYTNVELVIWKVPTEAPSLRGQQAGSIGTEIETKRRRRDGSRSGTTTSARSSGSSRGGASSSSPVGRPRPVRLTPGLPGCSAREGANAARLARANSDTAFFASHPKYKFVMVNHVTTNSFFTATIYGLQDACAITGCSYQWTGSTTVDRQPDGLGDECRDRRQGERDRGLPDRQHVVQQAHRQRAQRAGSPSSPTTPTSRRASPTTGWPTSARTT